MGSALLASGLILGSAAVLWLGSTWLEDASERLGRLYGLPQVVQGSIVIAIGSSFPELASAVLAAVVHDAFQLGVGVIVGSALFNVLVIPAVSALASRDLPTNRDLVFKEGLFYLVSVVGFFLLLSTAALYNPTTPPELGGLLTRPLVLVPLALYAFYLLLQWADTRGNRAPAPPGEVSPPRAWARLVGGLVLILVSAEGLISGVLMIGEGLAVPEIVWGLTILAAATSLPDAFASLRAARRDRSVASLGNVLGSNTFDLLVIVPVGVLLAGASVVDMALTGPLLLVLAIATGLLIAFMRTGMVLTKREGASLLVAYGAFLVVILQIGGVVSLGI